MIQLLYGKKGLGKTKVLVEKANDLARESDGSVVFLDISNQLICDLNYKIRFINVSEYPVRDSNLLQGFISGILAVNYDVQHIIIDGLTYIVKESMESMGHFFEALNHLSEQFNVDFLISASGDVEKTPEFVKKHILAV